MTTTTIKSNAVLDHFTIHHLRWVDSTYKTIKQIKALDQAEAPRSPFLPAFTLRTPNLYIRPYQLLADKMTHQEHEKAIAWTKENMYSAFDEEMYALSLAFMYLRPLVTLNGNDYYFQAVSDMQEVYEGWIASLQ